MTNTPLLDNDHPDSTGFRPMTRAEGIAYLMRDGNLGTPGSPFGELIAEVAAVVWRASYVFCRESYFEINEDILDQFMDYAINEPHFIYHIIRRYGHRMYR